MQRPDEDNLFEVKTHFYIGAFQQVLNETANSKSGRTKSIEQDCYMWRAYIAQNKYRVVLDGINVNEQSVLQGIRRIAEYFAFPDRQLDIVKYFDEKFAEDFDDDYKPIWCIAAATIYYNRGLYEFALKVLHDQLDLECLAMSIQCLLKMNRLDVAKKILIKMQEKDDDATITQLATAWINIQIGGEKLQDAYFIYQDFCDKFMATNTLLNGQAVCYIGQQKYEEAESALKDSLDKDPNNYDTLVNLIVLSQHTEKNSDAVNRYLSQVQDSHKDSLLVQELEKKEAEFDRLIKMYAPSVSSVAVDAAA